jgi:hypothetical protein
VLTDTPTNDNAVTKRLYSDSSCVNIASGVTYKADVCGVIPAAAGGGSMKITSSVATHGAGVDTKSFQLTMYSDAGCSTAVATFPAVQEGKCTASATGGTFEQYIQFTPTSRTLIAGVYTDNLCTTQHTVPQYLHTETLAAAESTAACDTVWTAGITGGLKTISGFSINAYIGDTTCAGTAITVGPAAALACTEISSTTFQAALGCSGSCYAAIYETGQAAASSASTVAASFGLLVITLSALTGLLA